MSSLGFPTPSGFLELEARVGAGEKRQNELMVIRNYVNVTSDVGQDEVVCFFNLIFHAGLG